MGIGQSCMFVFIQSVNFWLQCFQVELVDYCTVHISIRDNFYLFTLLNKMLVSCTFLPVHRISSIYPVMRVLYFIVFCFNALLNLALLLTELLLQLQPPPQNSVLIFLMWLFLFIQRWFYISRVLLYLNVVSVSVVLGLKSLEQFCHLPLFVFFICPVIDPFQTCPARPSRWHCVTTCSRADR